MRGSRVRSPTSSPLRWPPTPQSTSAKETGRIARARFPAPVSLYSLRQGSQSGGGILWGDIALRHAEHLEPHHKLADGSRAQQRRIEMRVEVPLGMRLA